MQLSDFPLQTFDKVRYADTDRQGHVNNAVFSSFLETGRVELLYAHSSLLPQAGCSFVIASLKLDFCAKLFGLAGSILERD
jgi:acyl-CoA thioester hydrolase